MPLLFSYGTLRQPEVQLETFGRLLEGHEDALPGFEQCSIQLDDPRYAGAAGATYSIVRFTGDAYDLVPGTVLEVTGSELARADAYEPAPYVRIAVRLASGREAWVYADVRATGEAGSAHEKADT
jgi:gamma-glutamylcyclotransferase (GGCT)/AIG2-like uncharacterized protein YtfP